MSQPSKRDTARAVLARFGRTYADELGIRLAQGTPAPLFQLLCAALLLSARLPAANAVQAARALREAGLTTPRKMAAASWQERVDVITWHGYKRYDERTATMLGQTAELLLERWQGDLRRLRDEAGRDPQEERRLLQEFKGIGPVGADIFLREVQPVWDEVYPWADERVLRAARRLDLGADARALARLVERRRFPALVAGLIRIELADGYEEVREAAA